jgi:hypothetical protein
MSDDGKEGWLALDSREQALRSPVRTCAHSLELGNASGMFSTEVMEAWESKIYSTISATCTAQTSVLCTTLSVVATIGFMMPYLHA